MLLYMIFRSSVWYCSFFYLTQHGDLGQAVPTRPAEIPRIKSHGNKHRLVKVAPDYVIGFGLRPSIIFIGAAQLPNVPGKHINRYLPSVPSSQTTGLLQFPNPASWQFEMFWFQSTTSGMRLLILLSTSPECAS